MREKPLFNTFPDREVFAMKTGIPPSAAIVLLNWIAEASGTNHVGIKAATMAAFAIKSGMAWKDVVVVFASWYEDYKRKLDEIEEQS